MNTRSDGISNQESQSFPSLIHVSSSEFTDQQETLFSILLRCIIQPSVFILQFLAQFINGSLDCGIGSIRIIQQPLVLINTAWQEQLWSLYAFQFFQMSRQCAQCLHEAFDVIHVVSLLLPCSPAKNPCSPLLFTSEQDGSSRGGPFIPAPVRQLPRCSPASEYGRRC